MGLFKKEGINMSEKINILGVDYLLEIQSPEDNHKLISNDGVCEIFSKKIIIASNIEEPDVNNFENIEEYVKKVKRHEITHAFFMNQD